MSNKRCCVFGLHVYLWLLAVVLTFALILILGAVLGFAVTICSTVLHKKNTRAVFQLNLLVVAWTRKCCMPAVCEGSNRARCSSREAVE